MNKEKKTKIDIKVFEKYMDDWNKLDVEYNNVLPIPIYHFIKQIKILNQKSKLTNDYKKYLNNRIY